MASFLESRESVKTIRAEKSRPRAAKVILTRYASYSNGLTTQSYDIAKYVVLNHRK